MALSSRVEFDASELTKYLKDFGDRALPLTISDTVTELAFRAQKRITSEISRRIDNPVPFTAKAPVFVVKASFKKDPIESVVGLKDRQAMYMGALVDGDTRGRGDYGFTKDGPLVPTPSMPLTSFGNFPLRGAKRFLAAVANKKGKWKNAFYGEAGKSGTLGVWFKKKSQPLTLLATIKPSIKYKKKLPILDIVDDVVKADFNKVFNDIFRRVVK